MPTGMVFGHFFYVCKMIVIVWERVEPGGPYLVRYGPTVWTWHIRSPGGPTVYPEDLLWPCCSFHHILSQSFCLPRTSCGRDFLGPPVAWLPRASCGCASLGPPVPGLNLLRRGPTVAWTSCGTDPLWLPPHRSGSHISPIFGRPLGFYPWWIVFNFLHPEFIFCSSWCKARYWIGL